MRNIAIIFLITYCSFYTSLSKAQSKNDNLDQNYIRVADVVSATGNSNLTNGSVYVELPQKIKEDISGRKYTVILTSNGTWSALYIKEFDEKGFLVKAESGDLNAKFFWQISTIANIEEKK